MGRILALDFGLRRVGCAISDPGRTIASPLEVYERRNDTLDARHYRELVQEHEVERIVVGLPVHTSGREGQLAGLARKWGSWLALATERSVVYSDERYTSVEADNRMIELGLKRQKRKELARQAGGPDLAPGLPRRGLSRARASQRAASRSGGARPVSTLIVGCGYLGARVGAALSRRREQVFGTLRSSRRSAELASLGIEPVLADVLRPESLQSLPQTKRVLYCIGFDRAGGADMRTVYVQGLSNLLERSARIGRAAGLRRQHKRVRTIERRMGR